MTENAVEKLLFAIDPTWLARRAKKFRARFADRRSASSSLGSRGCRYLLDELLADTSERPQHSSRPSSCNARSMYRADGAGDAPVGETEFVNGVAAMARAASTVKTKACAGIVGFADLVLGERLIAFLKASPARRRALQGRPTLLRLGCGSRPSNLPRWIPPAQCCSTNGSAPALPARSRMACPSTLAVSPQIPELSDLARAFPEPTIILDHVGAPLGVGA